jgi:hypothetical protein
MKVLLLGLGKSGTTALMVGVSEALGIPFLMEPKNLARIDYSAPVVVKKLIDDLSPGEERYLKRFDRIVLIVRDPRDALISRLLYRPYGLPAFRRDRAVRLYIRRIAKKIARPSSVSVREILALLQGMSKDRTLDKLEALHAQCTRIYQAHAGRMLLCRYEDFVAGNTAALEAYVGARLPAKIEVGGDYRRVARSGSVGAWKHWFTPEDVAFFDGLFADFYAAFGYRPETPHAAQRIDRADTIDYTVRLINEWRARRNLPPFDPAGGPLRLRQLVAEAVPRTTTAPKTSVYRALRARLSALLSG